MTVSRETDERLCQYEALLRRWNAKINLVSPNDMVMLNSRHIQDCLQLSELAPGDVDHWADLGSGGGLPGLIVAFARAHLKTKFTLVESDQRKAAFLRQVTRETHLKNVAVLAQRIETAEPLAADIVSARALAPLPKLMPYLARHLSPTGRAFLLKGRQWQAELREAQDKWDFLWAAHPSRTDDEAAVLEISRVSYGPK